MSNERPAPLAVWGLIHPRFSEITFQGISRGPGHEDHSEGRALDLGLSARNPNHRRLADALLTIFIRNAGELGWSYIIWNHFIWYSDARSGPYPYTGENPHTDHIHVSWSRSKSQLTSFPNMLRDLSALSASRPAASARP